MKYKPLIKMLKFISLRHQPKRVHLSGKLGLWNVSWNVLDMGLHIPRRVSVLVSRESGGRKIPKDTQIGPLKHVKYEVEILLKIPTQIYRRWIFPNSASYILTWSLRRIRRRLKIASLIRKEG